MKPCCQQQGKKVVYQIVKDCRLVLPVLGELWLIIGNKIHGPKDFDTLKSTIEESHNVYIDKSTYNCSFLLTELLFSDNRSLRLSPK